MKEEDLDWRIYHLLAEDPGQDIGVLSGKAGCSSDEVAASLDRLEKFLLVEQCEGKYRIRSLPEMLLSCQAAYDESAPFIIENGIVRERKRQE